MSLPTIHQTPFARFLLPMIVGIVIYNYVASIWIGVTLSIATLAVYTLHHLSQKGKRAYQYRHLFGIFTTFAFVCIGFFLSCIQDKKAEFDFREGKRAYSAEVKSVPEEKEHSIYCQLELINGKKIIAYFRKESKSLAIRQGDHLLIYTEPRPLTNTNRPGGFNFASYMHRQGFAATAYIDSAFWRKQAISRTFNLKYIAADWQAKVITIFRSFGFHENEFALLSGITIGYQDALTIEQKSNFSAVGLSHLMAVSGMQTAMIYGLLWFLLGFIPKNSRFYRLKYVVVIIGLWVFTFITGLSASVVRASIMLTVLMVGGLFRKQAVTLNSLMFAAFCLLLYNPFSLYDIGFQLSFLAVLSILIAQDLFKERLDGMKKAPRYFSGLIIMTLAAQLGTSPLSIFYFHQFPLLFLIVNLIVLPLNSALVYLACWCTFLASIHIPHLWFDKILQWMLAGLDYLTKQFAMFPFAQLKDLQPSTLEIVLFYLFMGFVLTYIYQKRFRLILYSMGVVWLISLVMVVQKLDDRHHQRLYIYNQFGKNRVEFIANGKSHLCDTTCKAVVFGNKKIVVLDKDIRHTSADRPLRCDILVLAKGFKGKKMNIDQLYLYNQLIMDASLSRYYGEQLRTELKETGLDYFDMNEKGAFVMEIPTFRF